ncbi:glycoside hydrolase family 57 [Hippea alviniae]|uniref:glycoside hydrolase family 57 n=1 Tax=Hippea alviniae TaxID=1279027 RepID=UPI0003B3F24B|nr:glycoside hydrolase family 57 [Hippea alviniae]
MLNLYLIFHLNLMYSSIEEEQRKDVIKKCYFPLLDIAENFAPVGIEATGLTLEIINSIEPSWIDKLKKLVELKRVEFVASGYSQIIGPLMPKVLNIKNQEIGLEVYKSLLGIKPKIVLVNEMAYSKGLVDIYADFGFKAFIMEWNNPYRFHKEWDKEIRYYPCMVEGVRKNLPVIWADSIAFQKFQRYAHGEMSLKEYVEYISSHNSEKPRFFPLYANDAEIFNFRPGRYKTEGLVEHDEWNRIKRLLCVLDKKKEFEFVLPSELTEHVINKAIRLESPQQPIPVKKQEKYNINRWALTGRNDLEINTDVFRLTKALISGNANNEEWKKLLYFASSDFRTHITDKRWKRFRQRIERFKEKFSVYIEPLSLPLKEIENLKVKNDRFNLEIETDSIGCVFNKIKGLTAKSVVFKDISNKPLIGTIQHGYYDDISLGADFFSFHSIIERPGEHKFTNLGETEFVIEQSDDFVKIEDTQQDKGIVFKKSVCILKDAIRIGIKIELPNRKLARIHPFNITFIPDAWDRESLFFATHNGSDKEIFYLKNVEVNHAESLSALISAKYGLGATEGIMFIGDRYKTLQVIHNPLRSALIPFVFFKPMNDTFFLRLEYSACEMDDTFKESKESQNIECEFIIRAAK